MTTTDETNPAEPTEDLEAAARHFGVSVEYLRQLPRHDADCLIGKPHLTCTCGAYGRARRAATDGDQQLRDPGTVCAKQFGLVGAALSRCDRPYGHTGSHTAEGASFSGARDAEDEARTAYLLSRGS